MGLYSSFLFHVSMHKPGFKHKNCVVYDSFVFKKWVKLNVAEYKCFRIYNIINENCNNKGNNKKYIIKQNIQKTYSKQN